MRLPTRSVVPGILAAAVLPASAACTVKTSGEPANDRPRASGRAGGGAQLADGSGTKVALVPGGAHPYFHPWKTAGAAAEKAYGLGDVTFDETAEWDQQKQNNLLSTLAARGYNAFGVFGVSPTDINTTIADLKSQGLAVASLGSCPAGGTNETDFCLSTDVELAAYKAARAAIDAMGGKGTLVHLTGNNVDANTQLRMKGVSKAVAESGGKVELLQTITDIDKDLQTAQKAVSDLLAAKGSRIQGIVATACNPAMAAADAVGSAGSKAEVVAIDDAVGGAAAAGGDSEGALHRQQGAAPGRADRLPVAAGGGAAVRGGPAPGGQGYLRRLRQPHTRRGLRPLRHRHGAP